MPERRRSIPVRAIAGLLGIALALPLVVIGRTSPVAADCGSGGIVWPHDGTEVRGLAFTGTALEPVEGSPTQVDGMRFSVDEVFDGAVGSTIVVMPWCVGTRFEPGQRYLISTSDTLPAPG